MAGRPGVQTFVVGAVGLVLGLVLGGLGPRQQLRDAQQQIFDLQKKAAAGGANPAGVELARLLTQGIQARHDDHPSGTPVVDAPSPAPVVAVPPTPPSPVSTPSGSHGTSADDIEAARQVLELRSSQARRALIEDADPTPEQLKTIDGAIADMNQQLLQSARTFADSVKADGEPKRRDIMAFGADALGLFTDTEDKMLNALTPEQRASVSEDATDPTSFIDPEVVSIFREVEDDGTKAGSP